MWILWIEHLEVDRLRRRRRHLEARHALIVGLVGVVAERAVLRLLPAAPVRLELVVAAVALRDVDDLAARDGRRRR